MIDAAYSLTRRNGKPGVVTTFDDFGYEFDEETGKETGGNVEHKIRFMVKEPTKYKRVISSNAAEGNIGTTTFVMWLKDTKSKFSRLDGEDFITFETLRYEVVSFSVENESAVIVTANQVKRG